MNEKGMTVSIGDEGAHLARFLIAGLLTAFGGRSASVALTDTKRLWEGTKNES